MLNNDLNNVHIRHCFQSSKIQLDDNFQTRHELEVVSAHLVEHLSLSIPISLKVDITKGVVPIVANTNLVEAYFALVEATKDKIDYYGLLDSNDVILCTKFQKCVVLSHGRLVVLEFESLQGKKLAFPKILFFVPSLH